MRIRKEDEYNYLFNKSTAYIAGWCSCQGNERASTFKKKFTTEELEEFDQGYSDCYANGESESVAFDYVAGI